MGKHLTAEQIVELIALREMGVKVDDLSERFDNYDSRAIQRILAKRGIKVGSKYRGRTDRISICIVQPTNGR
jgi:hypothetical protein